VKGFGGIGGFLRFKMDLDAGNTPISGDDVNDDDNNLCERNPHPFYFSEELYVISTISSDKF
jgi:hypothetical protein